MNSTFSDLIHFIVHSFISHDAVAMDTKDERVPLSTTNNGDTTNHITPKTILTDIIKPCLPIIVLLSFISITIIILTSGCFIYCYDDTLKVISLPTKIKQDIRNACSNKETLKTGLGKKKCRELCKKSKCCVMPITNRGSCLQTNEDTCADLFQYCRGFYYGYDDDDDKDQTKDNTKFWSRYNNTKTKKVDYNKENNIVATTCSKKNLAKNKNNKQLLLKCYNECSDWSCCWEKDDTLNCYANNVNECVAHMMCPDFR